MLSALRLALLMLAPLALLLAGCPEKKKPEEPAKTPVEQPPPTEPTSAPASQPAEAAGVGAEACLKPFSTDGPEKTVQIEGKTYGIKGSVITLKTDDPDNTFTIGQLSDVKEDTPENLGNVAFLLAWLMDQRADVLVVTGDLGESQPSIEKVMRALAAFKGPVFVMIGNREGITDFEKAYDAVSPELPNLFNMNRLRLFNADDVSVVSLPGYFNPAYIHSQDGCQYRAEDLKDLEKILEQASSTVVLASHGPPRMEGITGIDRIHEGVNVGDPALARFLAEKKVHFGLFGNIHEAGGKGTDLSGQEEIRQGTFVNDVYVNPGPTDAVRWPLLDGTESVGMGGFLRVKGKQAMYTIRRIRPGEAKPVEPAAGGDKQDEGEGEGEAPAPAADDEGEAPGEAAPAEADTP